MTIYAYFNRLLFARNLSNLYDARRFCFASLILDFWIDPCSRKRRGSKVHPWITQLRRSELSLRWGVFLRRFGTLIMIPRGKFVRCIERNAEASLWCGGDVQITIPCSEEDWSNTVPKRKAGGLVLWWEWGNKQSSIGCRVDTSCRDSQTMTSSPTSQPSLPCARSPIPLLPPRTNLKRK